MSTTTYSPIRGGPLPDITATRRGRCRIIHTITSFHRHGAFLRWVEAHPDVAWDLLARLWADQGDVLERFEAILLEVPTDAVKGRGPRLNVLGLLLLAVDPYGLPPFNTTALERS